MEKWLYSKLLCIRMRSGDSVLWKHRYFFNNNNNKKKTLLIYCCVTWKQIEYNTSYWFLKRARSRRTALSNRCKVKHKYAMWYLQKRIGTIVLYDAMRSKVELRVQWSQSESTCYVKQLVVLFFIFCLFSSKIPWTTTKLVYLNTTQYFS